MHRRGSNITARSNCHTYLNISSYSGPNGDSHAYAIANLDTITYLDSGANANIGSYADPCAHADARTDPHVNPGSYGYAHTNVHTNTHAHPDAYANSHSRSNGHADACTYTNADTVSTSVVGGVERPAGQDREASAADLLYYVLL